MTRLPETSTPQTEPKVGDNRTVEFVASGFQQGVSPSRPENQLLNNPLRSLGDALKEIQQRFDDVLDSKEVAEPARENSGEMMDKSQVQYLHPDDTEHDMQALGPADQDQVAKLNEIKLANDRQADETLTAMDVDPPSEIEKYERPSHTSSLAAEPTTRSPRNDVEGAVTQADLRDHNDLNHSSGVPDIAASKADVDLEEPDNEYVETKLRQWRAEGLPDNGAEHIWRLYESLTHDLAYALCEQLRLILEPTLATRLKGDYRTGKRLNMKKIIPYIASDYTKDKIWMRRTRPSQREYQVLIALDDSRSMAESHSIHLAYETLALVSKALSRLEAGDIAIAKFGETVDILHGFDEGPFTDQAGTSVMNAFHFNQKATDVLSLINLSLNILDHARERRSTSSSSAAELWQLEIIISDGICQDHDLLRTIMRKAEEQRVMIVFVIVDSLHSATTTAAPTKADALQNSILSMNQVAYKNVGGRMELQMERYLDSFPFEYYVVLRNVEALPEVLSGTLKQFFERVSGE
jgi:midasin